jgi:hypothetical protein
MRRIAYRPLAFLACAVILVGLIAARPLPLPSASEAPRAERAAPPKAAPPRRAAPRPAARRPSYPTQAQELRAELAAHRAAALEAATRPPERISGDGPWMRGERVAQTERLDVYAGAKTFGPEQVAALAPQIERALRRGESRLGTRLTYRVSIAFYRKPPQKGIRGMAYTDEARAELFYLPGEDAGRALTIAAHELAHHLEAQRYGNAAQRRADTILHEGLATWISGDYWLPHCGATSWRERARQLRGAGIPLRLLTAESYGADNAYEMWASFADYLIRQYGWKKFDALYASGRGRAHGSSDYQGVLGKSLDELADEWRAWVG